MANGLSLWQKFWQLLDRGLFGSPSEGDGLVARTLRVLRYPYAILRDLLSGELTLRATGLVYATLLALIPLIALSFALLKAVDAHRDLEPFLLEFFRPVGEAGPVITHRIMVFAENVSGGLVGILGFTVLLWTLVGAVKKIEDSLNYVWQVRRARSIARRVLEYVALLVIGPLVIAAVIAFSKPFGQSKATYPRVSVISTLPSSKSLHLFFVLPNESDISILLSSAALWDAALLLL